MRAARLWCCAGEGILFVHDEQELALYDWPMVGQQQQQAAAAAAAGSSSSTSWDSIRG
jgi:hypothetical protein